MFSRVTTRFFAPTLLGLVVAACSGVRGPDSAMRELRQAIRERGLSPEEIVVPFELDEDMEEWARSVVPESSRPDERLRALLDAILDRRGLELQYNASPTGTAREVFESRVANCLSFTHLFVGLARAVGLPAYFLKARELESFSREGSLVIVSGHVTAGYGPAHHREVLDFAGIPLRDQRRVTPITDLVAIALFYSNRGAELLIEGEIAEAMEQLRIAVRLAPELPEAWVNLGVARRRSGDVPGAEEAYWRALEVEPDTLSAYQNLSALLRLIGRDEQAIELLQLTDRWDNQNPFNYLTLGDVSLQRGRLDQARRYYRRASDLLPGDPEPLAALGSWALAAGRPELARRWLQRAASLGAENPRVRVLSQRLEGGASAERPVEGGDGRAVTNPPGARGPA